MLRSIMIIAIFVTLFGCASHNTGPENNEEFYSVNNLSEFEGVYKNKGNPNGYLSYVIWGNNSPQLTTIDDHKFVDSIEVLSNLKSLTVKAIKGNCAIYEKSYNIDKDFDLSGGRIIINRTLEFYQGPGDPLFGPKYTKLSLGIDKNKDGKMRRYNLSTGLVYMIVPVAFWGSDDVRFEKIKDKQVGYKPCISH